MAILGYTNANMKAWLTEELWSGMHFVPIVDVVQADVDAIRAKEKPDVLIVVMHSGTGAGDGKQLESEGLDVFNMVQGVDFVLASHDHRPYVDDDEDNAFLNSGSHSRNLAEGTLRVTVKDHKIVSKTYDSGLIPVKASKADADMKAVFYPDYQAVKAFTLQEIGILNTDLWTRDAYRGMCDYLNLIHTLSLGSKPAEISFAAPLTFNGHVNAGIVKYNDLFTIYPFENQLFVVKMTGEEIRNYLEHSYDQWINTIAKPDDRLLKIQSQDDHQLHGGRDEALRRARRHRLDGRRLRLRPPERIQRRDDLLPRLRRRQPDEGNRHRHGQHRRARGRPLPGDPQHPV